MQQNLSFIIRIVPAKQFHDLTSQWQQFILFLPLKSNLVIVLSLVNTKLYLPHDLADHNGPSSCYILSIWPANKLRRKPQRIHHRVCGCVCVYTLCIPGCAVLLCAGSGALSEWSHYSQDRGTGSVGSAFHAEQSLPLLPLWDWKRKRRQFRALPLRSLFFSHSKVTSQPCRFHLRARVQSICHSFVLSTTVD